MGELINFEPSKEQFGVLWKYIEDPNVTDVDYNGTKLWITDFEKGRYEAPEKLDTQFIDSFTHIIANCVNKPFNNANAVLEADTKELRISILHESVATTGISICIRKSPPIIRNTLESMIKNNYCQEEVLHLLINCVLAKMNFVFGGDPGSGKTECAKFFMQFIPKSERVITIEDSPEIHYSDINSGADGVQLQIRKGFDYTDAIKSSLRQSPTWLMLSEARSVEVISLLEQWSTGIKGFTTIHLDDLRKLSDRIQSMMDSNIDADRMESRIYGYVNVGVLIRKVEESEGKIWRHIDQLCFYCRENGANKIYMLVKDGELISKELPKSIIQKMNKVGIEDPFCCKHFREYINEGK